MHIIKNTKRESPPHSQQSNMTVLRVSYCSPMVPVKFIGYFWKHGGGVQDSKKTQKVQGPLSSPDINQPTSISWIQQVTRHTTDHIIKLLLRTPARSDTTHQTATLVSIKSRTRGSSIFPQQKRTHIDPTQAVVSSLSQAPGAKFHTAILVSALQMLIELQAAPERF